MKLFKTSFVIMAAFVMAIALSGYADAFHSGGVAECGGCHSMHSPAPGGVYLLVGTDQSSACLTCHENAADTGPSSYRISTADASLGAGQAPLQRTPGGDFGWLKKTYTWVVRGNLNTEDGATHGHNIIAVDKNYTADTHNTSAPGGVFPSNQLSCVSCHDPHGKYRRNTAGTISTTGLPIKTSGSYNATGNEPSATEAVGVYRLLAGAGYTKDGVTFNGVPAAKVPSTYNKSEALTQTRVAYGVASTGGHSTWGNWCGTCHSAMHSSGNYVHPVDQNLGSAIKTIYDTYVKTGDMTGSNATAFLSLVPFAPNTNSYSSLAGLSGNAATSAGPSTSDQVTCVSCHRAHASGAEYMLRWNNESTFITVNGAYATDPSNGRGRTAAEWQAAYYDRPATTWATFQRGLCNKCHAKD